MSELSILCTDRTLACLGGSLSCRKKRVEFYSKYSSKVCRLPRLFHPVHVTVLGFMVKGLVKVPKRQIVLLKRLTLGQTLSSRGYSMVRVTGAECCKDPYLAVTVMVYDCGLETMPVPPAHPDMNSIPRTMRARSARTRACRVPFLLLAKTMPTAPKA